MDAGASVPEAVVIGCRGFVGSCVVETMERDGIRVAGFHRDIPFLRPDGALARAIRGARVICYLATSITPAISDRFPHRTAADRDVFCRLLDALEAAGSRFILVLASSGGTVYDASSPPPYAESAPLRPVSEYGRAKLSLERELLARTNLTPVILRLSNVYGPGQRIVNGQGVVGHWLEAVRKGEPVQIYGDPTAARDYVYCEDVAEAFLAVCRAVLAGSALPPVMNIGSGQPTSLKELLGLVECAVGHETRAEYAARRRFDRHDVWLDASLASRALGWWPRTPLREGLARTWAEVRATGPGTAVSQRGPAHCP